MTDNMHGVLISALFLLLASLAHAMKKHRRRIEAIEGRIALEAQLKAVQ
jgi:hypothetical protein